MNIPPRKLQMIQKVAAMGNWWLAASQDDVPPHKPCVIKSFLMKHQITPVTQPPYSPDLAFFDFWLFLKLKLPLKGKIFQTIDEIQENTTGQLMMMTVWGPKVPTLKGPEVSLSCVQCFFCLLSSSINVSSFLIAWLDTFWTDLICIHLFLWILLADLALKKWPLTTVC